MIQLIIDYSTNKIMGYNSVIPQDTTDLIIVHEQELNQFSNQNNLYYENGKIVEKNEVDIDYQELQEIDEIEKEFQYAVNNEQKIFMDNILAGKSIEEATYITKINREQLANAKKLREQFDNNNNSAYAIATIIGSIIAMILNLNFNIMIWLATIGGIIDNIFYIIIYNKEKGGENV